jgi:23S rRNA (uridine2552-2'-O)-methyltransferase
MAGRVLKPGGSTLIKTFRGAGLQELVASARRQYGKVEFARPAASRARSPELYLLARDYRMV